MAAAAVRAIRSQDDPHPQTDTDEAFAGLQQVAEQAAKQTIAERQPESEASLALSARTDAACAALDSLTGAILDRAARLRRQLDMIESAMREQGERSKNGVRSHLGMADKFNKALDAVESAICDIQADAAKLVSGT